MIWASIESIWHFIWGWATVDLIVGTVAIVIAILEPPIIAALIPDLRKWAIAVAVVAFTFMGILAHGYQNGLAEKQRQWNEALARDIAKGEADRAAAVAAEPADTSDRSVFSDDIYNRDRAGPTGTKPAGKVRWFATDHLFGKR